MPTKKEPSRPEKRALPERPKGRPQEPSAGGGGGAPFFTEIQKILQGQDQLSESQFRSLRRERIRGIEDIRNSLMVAYYGVAPLDDGDAKMLHNVLSGLAQKPENLDLMVVSPGGLIDPAYKMALMCRGFCLKKFSVLVPYYAKSAATLLALGADEIVMGPTSELGPIDPQIKVRGGRYIPALSLRDAISFVQDRVTEHPEHIELFRNILGGIDVRLLGEYERVIAGSEQYARELLLARFKGDEEEAARVAAKLVDGYKIHSFVIDPKRAREELKLNVVEASGVLWQNMWQLSELYETLIYQSRRETEVICKVFETREAGPYYVRMQLEKPGGARPGLQPRGVA